MKLYKINLPINKSYGFSNYLVLGHFNLIHKGHLNLFKNLNDFSIMIFENNPNKNYYVYDLKQRINNLLKYHPKFIYLYDISKNNLTANEFIINVLKKLNFNEIVVGSDFCFGKNKSGNIFDLQKEFKIKIIKKNSISSYKIKQLIEEGNFKKANTFLNSFFYFENEVVKGKKIASILFKPTANIIVNSSIFLKLGSYLSVVLYKSKLYFGLSYLSKNSDINFLNSYILETHIFNFDKNLYNQKIKVYLLDFIRESKKFTNVDDLKKAINKDYLKALKYFDKFNLNSFKKYL